MVGLTFPVITVTWMAFLGLTFTCISGQKSFKSTQEMAGNDQNDTTVTYRAEDGHSESGRCWFLLEVLIISGSIAAVILILSSVWCAVYFLHNCNGRRITGIENSSGDQNVHFRRNDRMEVASVASWGSEFPAVEAKKRMYENSEANTGMSRQARGPIYANAVALSETTPSECPAPCTGANQYANLHGDTTGK